MGSIRFSSGGAPYLPFIEVLKGILDVEDDAASDVAGIVDRIIAIDDQNL